MPICSSAGSAAKPGGDVGADRRDAVGEDLAHVTLDQLVDHELLRELHHQPRELLERRLRPAARVLRAAAHRRDSRARARPRRAGGGTADRS